MYIYNTENAFIIKYRKEIASNREMLYPPSQIGVHDV